MKDENKKYYNIPNKEVRLFHMINEAVFIISSNTYEMLFANRTTCQMLALDHYYGGKCYAMLKNGKQVCECCNQFIMMKEGHTNSWVSYHPFLEKHFKIDTVIVRYQRQLCCLTTAIDITKPVEQGQALRKTLKKIKSISYTDEITKVHNRNAFIHDIKQYTTDAACNQSVGVVFSDLNGLKWIMHRIFNFFVMVDKDFL